MLVMAMSASALCSTRFGGGGGGAMLVMAMSAIGMEDAVIGLESDGDSSASCLVLNKSSNICSFC